VPALRETQLCVMDALLGRAGGHGAGALLRAGRRPAPARRLQIYRHNVFETAVATLGDVFPVVARLVGTDFFRTAGNAYARIHPSRSGDLRRFGGFFPDFLRDYLPAAALPYLGDVAALEWAYHHAYHERELPGLDPLRLAGVAADRQTQLRLHLQPSATLVSSPYPILGIWQANQPAAPEDATPISLDDGGVDLVVVQSDLEIEFRPLAEGECCWLRSLAAGEELADAVAAALDRDPGFDLAQALVRHLGLRLFVDVTLAGCDRSVIFP
jgi:hypothetical protein